MDTFRFDNDGEGEFSNYKANPIHIFNNSEGVEINPVEEEDYDNGEEVEEDPMTRQEQLEYEHRELLAELIIAVGAKNIPKIEQMLEAHPDIVNLRSLNNNRRYPLQYACWPSGTNVPPEPSMDVIKTLFNHNAYIHFDGEYCLRIACQYFSMDVIKYFIDVGADVNASESHGHSSLMYAIIGKRLEVVEYLVEKGANLHHVDHAGRNMLFMAAAAKSKPLLDYFIDKGLDINAVDNMNRNLLSMVVQNVWDDVDLVVDMVKYLVGRGLSNIEALRYANNPRVQELYRELGGNH
jgi:hypothetical protein